MNGAERIEAGQHVIAHCQDKPGMLDKALADAKQAGLRVVHYERHAGLWVFKLMKPKEAATDGAQV